MGSWMVFFVYLVCFQTVLSHRKKKREDGIVLCIPGNRYLENVETVFPGR